MTIILFKRQTLMIKDKYNCLKKAILNNVNIIRIQKINLKDFLKKWKEICFLKEKKNKIK